MMFHNLNNGYGVSSKLRFQLSYKMSEHKCFNYNCYTVRNIMISLFFQSVITIAKVSNSMSKKLAELLKHILSSK